MHRIGIDLERQNYLQRVPGSRLWTVGNRAIGALSDTLAVAASGAAVDAVLKRLVATSGELTSFAIRVRDEVQYVASVESPQELVLSFRVGRRAPLFCTSGGRLFLARESDAQLMEYLRAAPRPACTPFTVTEPERLAIVRTVRAAGHAITEQEYVLHVVGAAAPVVGADGTFYGADSIAAPNLRMGRGRLEEYLPPLTAAAGRLAEIFAANRRLLRRQ